MSEHWIVSAYRFHRHDSLEAAEAERDRLMEKHPSKTFRVYRVKDSLTQGASKDLLRELQDVLDDCEGSVSPAVEKSARAAIARATEVGK